MKHLVWGLAVLCGWPAIASAQDPFEQKMEALKKEYEARRKQMEQRFEESMKKMKQEFAEKMEALKRGHGEKHEKHPEKFEPGDVLKKLMHRLDQLERKVDELMERRGGDMEKFHKMLPRDFDFKDLHKELERHFKEFRRHHDDDDDDDDDKDRDFLFKRKMGDEHKFEFKVEPFKGEKKVIIEKKMKKDDCDDCDDCGKKCDKKNCDKCPKKDKKHDW